MGKSRILYLSLGTLTGLYFVNKYRFLTIPQFARAANFSVYHTGEVLRVLERRGAVGYFGYVSIPGHGKTPKVYYLKRKGFDLLRNEGEYEPESIGSFVEVHQELTWSPQMYHRLRLLDLFIALEAAVRDFPHLELIRTFIEYRRIKGTYARETTDYVGEPQTSENRIVPDGAFVLENRETGRRGLFLVEMDMGTERIVAKASQDLRATVTGKMVQYDRYLTSGRFALTYAPFGEFRSFTLLFVTYGEERIKNIRQAARDLPSPLHGYYRLGIFPAVMGGFLGPVWKSRNLSDTLSYALVGPS